MHPDERFVKISVGKVSSVGAKLSNFFHMIKRSTNFRLSIRLNPNQRWLDFAALQGGARSLHDRSIQPIAMRPGSYRKKEKGD